MRVRVLEICSWMRVRESEMINEAPDDIAFHFCGAAGLRISPLDLDPWEGGDGVRQRW